MGDRPSSTDLEPDAHIRLILQLGSSLVSCDRVAPSAALSRTPRPRRLQPGKGGEAAARQPHISRTTNLSNSPRPALVRRQRSSKPGLVRSTAPRPTAPASQRSSSATLRSGNSARSSTNIAPSATSSTSSKRRFWSVTAAGYAVPAEPCGGSAHSTGSGPTLILGLDETHATAVLLGGRCVSQRIAGPTPADRRVSVVGPRPIGGGDALPSVDEQESHPIQSASRGSHSRPCRSCQSRGSSPERRRGQLPRGVKRVPSQLPAPRPGGQQRGQVIDPPASRAAEAPPGLLALAVHLAGGVGGIVVGQGAPHRAAAVRHPHHAQREEVGGRRDQLRSSSAMASPVPVGRSAKPAADRGRAAPPDYVDSQLPAAVLPAVDEQHCEHARLALVQGRRGSPGAGRARNRVRAVVSAGPHAGAVAWLAARPSKPWRHE